MADEGHTEEARTEEAHAAEDAAAPEALEMMTGMPPMLAYTIRGSLRSGVPPFIRIGQGSTSKSMWPSQAKDDSYWIVVLDVNKPTNLVQDWVIPGSSNTAIPSGLDQYMSKPGWLFVVATQFLSNYHVPQGDFYDYLAAHGAGRELQKLEQVSAKTQTGYGLFSQLSYVLTGQTGATGSAAYERGSWTDAALLLMSLMPLPSGQPPYSICDTYTFITR
jgi:hypothetical protein